MDYAVAINECRQIAGYTTPQVIGARTKVVLWESGRLRDLGTLGDDTDLPIPDYWPSHPQPGADVLNDRGQVVGSSWLGRFRGTHAFLWQTGRMRDLRTLGGRDSEAVAVNERGEVIGRSDTGRVDDWGGRVWRAFIWRNGRMRDLGTLGGEDGTHTVTVKAIDDRGRIVGEGGIAVGDSDLWEYRHAFLWVAGTMRDLGTLGGPESFATAMNNRGQVIGTADTALRSEDGGHVRHAFLWENGRMRDLGRWRPVDINERGQIVGQGGGCRSRSVLWASGRLRTLGVLPGDRYSQAVAINDRGQVVGVSYRECGGRYDDEVESPRPFVWRAGQMKLLPGLARETYATVTDVNNRGEIIGFGGRAGSFLWTPRAR